MPNPPPTSGVIGAHLVRRNLQHPLGDDVADGVRALAAERECVGIRRRVVFADRGAGIEIIGDHALVDDFQRNDARGFCECGLRLRLIAEGHLERQVARPVRPDLRRPLFKGRLRADNMRQGFPFDVERLGGVARLVERFRHDESHCVADVPHFVRRQHRVWRDDHFLARHAGRARQMAEVGEIPSGQDKMHAGNGPRLVRVLDLEARMGMRRAHHHAVQETGRRMVRHIMSMAANEGIVFLADNRLTDAKFHQGIRTKVIPPAAGGIASAVVRDPCDRRPSAKSHRRPV